MDYLEWQAINFDFKVRIDKVIFQQLIAYRQTKSGNEPESLGVLIGLVWQHAFWVKKITLPTPYDKLSRYDCCRTERSAQYNYHILKYINQKFDNKLHYLGEWHTHAENNPYPSYIDYINWKKLPDNKFYGRNIRLFMILGTKDFSNDWLSIKINDFYSELKICN